MIDGFDIFILFSVTSFSIILIRLINIIRNDV